MEAPIIGVRLALKGTRGYKPWVINANEYLLGNVGMH